MNEKKDLNRAQIVNNLAEFREMWESTGDDLTETTASVGLLLADVLVVLGLDDSERAAVLGPRLAEQIEAVSRPSQNKKETDMNSTHEIEVKLDLALAQLQASPENGKTISFHTYEGRYILRTIRRNPFTFEVLAPTGETWVYELAGNG